MIEQYKELLLVGRKLLDDHGLSDWTFDVENCQNKSKWGNWHGGINGVCDHLRKLIAVDNKYLGHTRAARQIILHEMTHALGSTYRVFGGHGPKFCKLARKLGCRTEGAVGKYEWSWRYRRIVAGTRLDLRDDMSAADEKRDQWPPGNPPTYQLARNRTGV